jgi:hypothetical protein
MIETTITLAALVTMGGIFFYLKRNKACKSSTDKNCGCPAKTDKIAPEIADTSSPDTAPATETIVVETAAEPAQETVAETQITPIPEQPAVVVEAVVAAPTVSQSKITIPTVNAIPEDSTLRRHYLSMIRANIEKAKAPRPTDSALRRHYDAMIDAEVEKQLAQFN